MIQGCWRQHWPACRHRCMWSAARWCRRRRCWGRWPWTGWRWTPAGSGSCQPAPSLEPWLPQILRGCLCPYMPLGTVGEKLGIWHCYLNDQTIQIMMTLYVLCHSHDTCLWKYFQTHIKTLHSIRFDALWQIFKVIGCAYSGTVVNGNCETF